MSKTSSTKLLTQLESVEGWLRDDEAILLNQLAAQATPVTIIVEIGSWKGKSTIALALSAKVPVYAIDPHTGSPEHHQKGKSVDTYKDFLNNIESHNLTKKVKPLRLTSKEAAKKINKPISLLFIDGDHSYQAVSQDFKDYYPKLQLGGTIAFHDTISWPGPRKLVTQQLYFGNHFKNIRLVGSITYAQKTLSLTIIDRLKNLSAYILRLLRNLIATIPMPRSIKTVLKDIFQRLQA
ncbi:class I SAM-dependent methyltransferase [Candidatus Chazhemtobacterium aquaticus]|uniref:Class I SAM-dependent methyltransferase n=1 Tax=Candidatus Chazhemtobacterium aquaticus TaxID=2715735 RepID=A0A857N5P4_9BACT|nr:class I SAM-dependent methyltransferase [Candidatus Chazhemtobacterium aquaticus]QHO63575.1 hypothetical protein MICH65_0594 [Candidatus Chazhemtobacterium aquaticus]